MVNVWLMIWLKQKDGRHLLMSATRLPFVPKIYYVKNQTLCLFKFTFFQLAHLTVFPEKWW